VRCENFEDVDIPTDTVCVKESLGHEAWNRKEWEYFLACNWKPSAI